MMVRRDEAVERSAKITMQALPRRHAAKRFFQ
jgi:hypothetical protein